MVSRIFVKSFFQLFKYHSSSTLWKSWKFTVTHLWQKFRENDVFSKEVTKELIRRKKLSVTVISFFHTVSIVGKRWILSLKRFPWNQLFSNLFSKTVTFTKFLFKKCKRISVISTPQCGKTSNFLSLKKILWNHTEWSSIKCDHA